ncbi:hypothetical protein L4D20_03425 [Vibrio kyushuensis]
MCNIWGQLTIGIPLVFGGYVSVIVSELQMQLVRIIVRLADAKIVIKSTV